MLSESNRLHVVIAHDFSTEEALRLLCSISLSLSQSLFLLFINDFEGGDDNRKVLKITGKFLTDEVDVFNDLN